MSKQAERQSSTGEVIDLIPRLRRGSDQPIRVLIAHQQRLAAETLMFVLDSDPGIEPIGYALDVHEAIALALLLEPDVVVASSELAGLDETSRRDEELRVWRRTMPLRIGWTADTSDSAEPRSISLGVAADQCADDLLATIEAVFAGIGSFQPRLDWVSAPAGVGA